MKLVLFIDGLGSGGAQRQFSYLARGLAAKGHVVTVAVYNLQDHFAAQIRSAGIDIVRLSKPSRFSLRPVFGLARLVRKRRPDVVIAFLRSPAAKAELAKLLVPEMKLIVAERSFYPDPPYTLFFRVTVLFHRLANFITVNSHNQKSVMERDFPKIARRVVTISNGIDIPQVTAPARDKADGALRLIAVSSLMPYKNSIRLVEAIAKLRDEAGLRVDVTWVGETFQSLPGHDTFRQTRERLKALGVEGQWHWVGVRQDVADLLAQHDALIHPSLWEGTSNAVCEAMAIGLPVIAARVADHEMMLETSGAGLLFDALDVQSMAGAIQAFASLSADSRRKMGCKGRGVIASDYGFDQMVSNYETLANAACSGDSVPPAPLLAHDRKIKQCAG